MRQRLLFSVLAVMCLGWIGAEEPNAPAPSEPQAWKGQPADKLVAVWGKPKKIKKDGSGGQVLIYRLSLPGGDGPGFTEVQWSDLGVGPSPAGVAEEPTPVSPGQPGSIRSPGSQYVAGTLKVRFYVDDEGTIYREEYAPVKWKKK